MDHQGSFYIVALSIVGAVGLVVKVLTMGPVILADASGVFDDVDQRMQSRGFDLASVQKVTTDGNFRLRLYRAPYCSQPVLLLPLVRNSEGALIMRSRLSADWRAPKFVLNGRVYMEFPTFPLWWRQVVSAFGVWNSERRTPIVWAVAEGETCAGTETFDQILAGA